MKLKKSAIIFLVALPFSAVGVVLKLNGEKTLGDIALLVSTALFYYFIYRAFIKKRPLAQGTT